MAQQGYLMIADISGYTAFLTQAELEHAHDIMQNLIHTLLESIKPPLLVSKLEGDAIFCYTPDGSFLRAQTLVEMVEQIYCAFSRAKDLMHINTTCTCTACTMIPTLDLKFVAHHGEFIISKIGKGEELTGPDVILIHRLLKSSIKESTGVDAYAFFSQACGLNDLSGSMKTHTENYEHVGDVPGFVHDLRPAWEHDRRGEHKRLTAATADLHLAREIPAPPALLWDYLTDPQHLNKILTADRVDLVDLAQGRLAPGATMHCVHGKETSSLFIVDWHPFNYYTVRFDVPFAGRCHMTFDLTPTATGTNVQVLMELNPQGMFAKLMSNLMIKREFAKIQRRTLDLLQQMVAEETGSGKVVSITQPIAEPLLGAAAAV